MEMYLIRHTAPDIEKGVCYGQSDVPLVKPFAEAFSRVEGELADVEVIYSSPLSRCKLLAEYLGEERGVPVIEDVRLMELNFGVWEMQRWDDIEPAVLLPWMDNYETIRCPGGESYGDLVARVQAFVDGVREAENRKVAVVTHGGVIRAFYAVLHGMSLKDSMGVEVKYGGIYR